MRVHFSLTYCLQEASAPDVPRALSAEEVGLGGSLKFGFELEKVAKLPDSQQDPDKSGDSATEDIVPNFGRDRTTR